MFPDLPLIGLINETEGILADEVRSIPLFRRLDPVRSGPTRWRFTGTTQAGPATPGTSRSGTGSTSPNSSHPCTHKLKRVEITNADRVVFPDDGITKGDVVAYYALVADRMPPFITGRALTVERFPRRIDTKGRARAPLKFEHAFSELTEIANLGAFRGLPGRYRGKSRPQP